MDVKSKCFLDNNYFQICREMQQKVWKLIAKENTLNRDFASTSEIIYYNKFKTLNSGKFVQRIHRFDLKYMYFFHDINSRFLNIDDGHV